MLEVWQVHLDTFMRLTPSIGLFLLVFRNFYRFRKEVVYLSALIFVFLANFMVGALYCVYDGFDPWLKIYSIVFLAVLIGLCFGFVRFSPYQQLLVMFLLENFVDEVSLLRDALFYQWMELSPTITYYPYAVLLRGALTLLMLPFLTLFFIKMVRPVIESDQHQPYHKYLWFVPACFFVIFRICVLPDQVNNIADGTISSLLLAIVWCVGTFLVYSLILQMLQETTSKAELQRKLEINAINTSVQRKLYENLLYQIKESRRSIHDFRHNILAIKNFTDLKQYDQLKQYLQEYIGTLSLENQLIFCEHPIINGVLQHYYTIAKEHHIDITIQFSLPATLRISDADICTLLGNALENAIEACSRQTTEKRYLDAKAELFHDSVLALTIRNSYEGLIRKSESGSFLSSKRDEEGIGVSSIQNIAQKYDGVCKIEYEDHVFVLSVMLIL